MSMRIVRKEVIQKYVEYRLVFNDKKMDRYAFVCDFRGSIDSATLPPDSQINLMNCRDEVSSGKRKNPVLVITKFEIADPAVATCECGGDVVLEEGIPWLCQECGQQHTQEEIGDAGE